MTQNPYQDPYSSDQFGTGSANSAPQFPQHDSQAGFQQPQYNPTQPAGQAPYPVYAVEKPTSQAAVWALVLGLLSVTVCTGLPAPIAIVMGLKGMKETKPGQPYTGNALAVVGLVTGIVGSLLLLAMIAYIVFIIVMVILAASSGTGA